MSSKLSPKAKFIERITEHMILSKDIKRFIDDMDGVTPFDIIDGFHEVIGKGYDLELIKTAVNKVLNLCYKSIKQLKKPVYKEESILFHLEFFNNEILEKLKQLKEAVKLSVSKNSLSANKDILLAKLRNLEILDNHYKIKENILFPQIEKLYPYFKCLKIMWSEHDDVRTNLKVALRLLSEPEPDFKKFNKIIGVLFFDIHSLIFRESDILFPAMNQIIDRNIQKEMLTDALKSGLMENGSETGFEEDEVFSGTGNKVAKLETGMLTLEQIKLIFNHLPVDITFIDENDEVKFFSSPKERIFIRTKSVIGRKVQNCHPHKSLHMVEEILADFKSGKRDHADFWINLKEKLIYIRYFAVRNAKREYMGTIEVTEDITDIKSIEGEKRLLE